MGDVVKPRPMRDALLASLLEEMGRDEEIFFVSADFGSPVLDRIRSDYPDRFLNVGIAEQNLINVSTGLALEGYKVFAYAIAPFITMRCYEQIRVNLALLSEVRPLNVNLIGVGAGYSYVVSGPTHQCYEDLSIMRTLAGIQVYSPADHITAEMLPQQCARNCWPKYIRLDAQVLPAIYSDVQPDFAAGFNVLARGKDTCLISTGYMTQVAANVVAELRQDCVSVSHADMFDLTAFDKDLLTALLSEHSKIVVLQEAFKNVGGLDALVRTVLSDGGLKPDVESMGVEQKYRFELGGREVLHKQIGLGKDAIKTAIVAERVVNLCG